MADYKRGNKGRFILKGDIPRKVRSIRLTDSTWKKLGEWANQQNVTRADIIEEWVNSDQ
ncbi:hypothetical protein PCC7418_1434 [Halothece sp. PCC 7418]|uniref:hypothetical protein n=1 Tax=Halothece sp. (strain PCC 7418) TaxID=65093 RepID=UPI0002A05C34|nr:hypothetical protein [Halothece sp. PCC 7418]AFZ43625.1 hypothetical protein PCC7418_1434 [Halothece sp. PCC 7418]